MNENEVTEVTQETETILEILTNGDIAGEIPQSEGFEIPQSDGIKIPQSNN